VTRIHHLTVNRQLGGLLYRETQAGHRLRCAINRDGDGEPLHRTNRRAGIARNPDSPISASTATRASFGYNKKKRCEEDVPVVMLAAEGKRKGSQAEQAC
jgi:hypothetical protein